MRLTIVEDRKGQAVAELTDEHPASSYGVPVLLIGEDVWGAADPVPFPQRAADLVLSWASHASIALEAREAARSFLASWPAGPQLPEDSGEPAIMAVIFVRDLDDRRIVTGEVPGPWPSEAAAVAEALLPRQRYLVRDGILYAQAMPEEPTS